MTSALRTLDDSRADPDTSRLVAPVLAAAEARCDAEGLRLTSGRRRVLEILVAEGRALGAYAILDRLRAAGVPAHPPVAYRALDFLVRHGFAHRVRKHNAFVACAYPGEPHTPALLVCRICAVVDETHAGHARNALGTAARASGFRIEHTVVEADGVCPDCGDTSDG